MTEQLTDAERSFLRSDDTPYALKQLKALRERDAFESRIRRAETMLIANSSYWASEALRALRGQET